MLQVETLYHEWLSQSIYSQDPLIIESKVTILEQALINLGLTGKTELDEAQALLLKEKLDTLIYFRGGLPSFILGPNQNPATDGDAMEIPSENTLDYDLDARNLLRHLLRGTPLCLENRASISSSPLFRKEVYECIFIQRNPELIAAVRNELQRMFNQAIEQLNQGFVNEYSYLIFQNTALSLYPFFDPSPYAIFYIPKKNTITSLWEAIPYKVKLLDISPKSGLLANLIEDQDKMYACALEPFLGSQYDSHLLLMGTTYPTGQGSDLANIYNFAPFKSVGEGHETIEVDSWLQGQPNKSVLVSGHSKGAAMSMQYAARYPDKIRQADCLNPPGLYTETLERLSAKWKEFYDQANIPCVNIYTQDQDPLFPWDGGFLPGMHIFKCLSNTKEPAINATVPEAFMPKLLPQCIKKSATDCINSWVSSLSPFYVAHIHNFTGRSNFLLLEVNLEKENNAYQRKTNELRKFFINAALFPSLYLGLIGKISKRKIERYFIHFFQQETENSNAIELVTISPTLLPSSNPASSSSPLVNQSLFKVAQLKETTPSFEEPTFDF